MNQLTKSGWFIRVTRPWEEFTKVVDIWIARNRCEGLVVYQHDADEEVNRTHVHFVVVNPKVVWKTFKNDMFEILGVVSESDYAKSKKEFDFSAVAFSYMTKGKYDPQFNNVAEYTSEVVSSWKSAWVEPNKRQKKAGKYQVMYDDFCKDMWKEFEDIPGSFGLPPNFSALKKYAWWFAFKANGCLATLETHNCYIMLVNTYLARNQNTDWESEVLHDRVFAKYQPAYGSPPVSVTLDV